MAVAVHPHPTTHPDPQPQHVPTDSADSPVTGDDAALCYDDMLRLTPLASPTPGQDVEPPYRCPVSTPANFVHPSSRVRRTKPMPVSLEISLTPRSQGHRSAGGKPPRPGAATHRNSAQGGSQAGIGKLTDRTMSGATGRGSGVMGPVPAVKWRSLEYYYVDKAEEEREASETNTFWLKALCSQPVHEILDKYRRRSELRRTRFLCTRTYTTPGERSLLRAWQRNAPPELGPVPRAFRAPSLSPIPSQARSGCRSLGNGRSKAASRSRNSGPASPRRFHSEPADGSRDYTSEEDESVTGDGVTEVGGSSVSGDASVSTPRYSLRKHSPLLRSPGSSIAPHSFPDGQLMHGQPGGVTPGNQHPVQPAYDISDHFQVCLPSVRDSHMVQQRQGAGQQRMGAGPQRQGTGQQRQGIGQQRQGTPKARAAINPLTRNRRQRIRDATLEELPSEVRDISRESNVIRDDVSNSTTQPATLGTSLPAIGRA